MNADSLSQIMNPTVDSLVSFCGIGDGIGKDLEERASLNLHLLKSQMGILQRKPRSAQDPIWHEVAAKHLPALVEKFRSSENDTPQNPPMALINVISYTPYFVRFVRLPSQQPSAGPTLAALQVHRWAESVRDGSLSLEADDVAEIGQFTATLLLLQGAEGVSNEDKDTLLPKLREWKRTYNGRLASDTSERCLALLGGDRTMLIMMQTVKRKMEGEVMQCGGPGCDLSKTPSGGELLRCAKCKTAVYCGTEHQKAAWSGHKKLCFPAAF